MKVRKVSQLHYAMKTRVARAMRDRHQAMTGAINRHLENGDADIADISMDPLLIQTEALQDKKVFAAVQAYRHAGGSVIDSKVVLPALTEGGRPDPNAAMKMLFEFKNTPTDVARIVPADPGKDSFCLFDSRHAVAVLAFLSSYYHTSEALLVTTPLPPGKWTIPDLPSDWAAEQMLRKQAPDNNSVVERFI